jgi:hypothetical protein
MFRAILLIIRRLNCINTASGVVTLRRWPYGHLRRELSQPIHRTATYEENSPNLCTVRPPTERTHPTCTSYGHLRREHSQPIHRTATYEENSPNLCTVRPPTERTHPTCTPYGHLRRELSQPIHRTATYEENSPNLCTVRPPTERNHPTCTPYGHLRRVTTPDAVLIQFNLLLMSKIARNT